MRISRKLLIAIIGSSLLFMANTANATLSLTVTDLNTSDSVSFTDNGVGDMSVFLGWLRTGGAIGNWAYGSDAWGAPIVGDQYSNEIDLSSSAVKYIGDSTGSLQISLTQTGIDKLVAPFNLGVGGTAAGTIQFESYINGVLVSDSGLLSGAFVYTDAGETSEVAAYDWTVVATITSGAKSESSFNYKVTIPEPGILSLLGLGMLSIGYISRKRKYV